jgi:hypothetical protein
MFVSQVGICLGRKSLSDTQTTNANEDSQSTSIVPIEQRDVDFYGDTITAALVETEEGGSQVYVPLRPICEYLGLDWSSQLKRIRRDPVLNEALVSVVMMTTEIERGRGQGRREALCLELEQLPGWLFGIEAKRVKPELRERVTRYRKDCFRVLWQAFKNEALGLAAFGGSFPKDNAPATSKEAEIEVAEADDLAFLTEEVYVRLEAEISRRIMQAPLDTLELALLQLREQSSAMLQFADQQLETQREVKRAHDRLDLAREFLTKLQRHLGATTSRVAAAENRLADFDERLERVEDRLSPPQGFITDDQAAVIAMEVKALAELLTTKEVAELNNRSQSQNQPRANNNNSGAPKRKPQNQYANIFAELYRRFSVSTYKTIRLSQYASVLQFLADWKKAADDGISNEVFLQGRLF